MIQKRHSLPPFFSFPFFLLGLWLFLLLNVIDFLYHSICYVLIIIPCFIHLCTNVFFISMYVHPLHTEFYDQDSFYFFERFSFPYFYIFLIFFWYFDIFSNIFFDILIFLSTFTFIFLFFCIILVRLYFVFHNLMCFFDKFWWVFLIFWYIFKNQFSFLFFVYISINSNCFIFTANLAMKDRNLPPSFYDASAASAVQQPCHNSTASHYTFPYHGYSAGSSGYAGYSDPYSYTSSFHHPTASFHHHHHHQSDSAWNYAAYNNVAQKMQMSAADFTANHHFNASPYNSLLSPGAIFPATPVGMRSTRSDVTAAGSYKSAASNWPGHSVFGAAADMAAHYSSPSGKKVPQIDILLLTFEFSDLFHPNS